MFILAGIPRGAVHPAYARAWSGSQRPQPRRPAMDVAEAEAAYTLTFDLPGMRREQVKVDVEGDRLRVEAGAADPSAGESRILWRERAQPRYFRELTLPEDADSEAIDAKFTDGVLSLTIGKRAKPAPVRVAVN